MPKWPSRKTKKNPRSAPAANSGRPRVGTSVARAKRLKGIALEVFCEFGYERAKLSEIARRAGASKETLYSLYDSKEAMFLAVMRDHLSGSSPSFSPFIVEETRSVKRDLESFLFKLLTSRMSEQQHVFAQLVFSGSSQFPEIGRLFWENAHLCAQHHLSLYLGRQIDGGRLARGDTRLMASQFLQLATGDVILRSLLNVQRSMSATEKRTIASSTVSLFLKVYGV